MEPDVHLERERAEAFNTVAESYERDRPGYPHELYECIVEKTGLKPGANLLEVGVGPGQATRLFLNKGYKIVGNEPGEDLRKTAWEKLGHPKDLTLEPDIFENWDAKNRTFDLIYSGSAFHWVDPEKGFPKAAALLKSSGFIALFWNMFPGPEGEIWKEINEVYDKLTPAIAQKRFKRNHAQDIEERRKLIEKSGIFKNIEVLHFQWEKTFDADTYIRLIMTYSDHILLESKIRKELCDSIAEVIKRHQNRIIRKWDTVLYLGQKA